MIALDELPEASSPSPEFLMSQVKELGEKLETS